MKLKRYYISSAIVAGSVARVESDEFHHLKNVMRTKVGEEIEVFNGDGLNGLAKVIKFNKADAEVEIISAKENELDPKINITLFQAVAKGDKLSLITQKITELGAMNLCVFYSKFSDIKDKTTRVDKLERVSISALKQCGRSKSLSVAGPVDFSEMISRAKKLKKVYCAYENFDGTTLYQSLSKNANFTEVGVIIGPEGGFDEKEVEIMKEAGFEIVSLGKRILRTETAAIASVAQLVFALEK